MSHFSSHTQAYVFGIQYSSVLFKCFRRLVLSVSNILNPVPGGITGPAVPGGI
jgi:hypothetical protein